jgi:NSS family neurotransmitter:Na+ symporter
MARSRAVWWVGGVGFLAGTPAALSLGFFYNQDNVWGIGLMLSGFFFAFAVLKFGVRRFRTQLVNHPGSDIKIGRWWEWAIVLCLVEAVVLMGWWFYQAGAEGWRAALDPISDFSIGTVLVQFGIVLAAFLLLNSWLTWRSGVPEEPVLEEGGESG